MKMRSPLIAILTILFIFGGILISMATGFWRSESSKVPATYASGEFAGQYNPGDIRGSYSFSDVASAFDVPVKVLLQAFGFEGVENGASLQIKVFEEYYGVVDGREVGTDSMRLFVALYIDRPYTPEEGTGLPNRAVELLRAREKLDSEHAKEIARSYSVELPRGIDGDGSTGTAVESLGSTASTASAEESEEDHSIKGKTTFRDVMEWGLTREEIEEVIDMPIGAPTQAMRDFFMEKGMEFSQYKEELQRIIDERGE